MKKIFLIALLALIAVGTAMAAAKMEISIPKYEPAPAQPGGYVEVWVKIQNIGDVQAANTKIRMESPFPFSLDPSETATKELGIIREGQYELVKYKVIVDEKSVQGENYIDIAYSFDGFNEIITRFPITVQTKDAILAVTSVSSEPDVFVAGENTKLYITVENMDDSFLRSISLKLGIDTETMPFAPAGSVSEKRIYYISAGEEETFEFDILTIPDADSGIYKVPVTLDYYDSTGESYSKSDVISLTVGGEPQLQVILGSSEITKAGSGGKVSAVLVNDGLVDLKFLKINLLQSEDYQVFSADEEYIGDLDSDDTDTVEFRVYAEKGLDELNLQFKVDYLDANNNVFSEIKVLSVPLYSSSQLSLFGVSKGPGALTIIIVLAVIGAAGFFAYNKFLKKR